MSDVNGQNLMEGSEFTDQDKVVSLFRFIEELNGLKQKANLNYKDHIWHSAIDTLPEDDENIQVYYRDRVEDDDDSVESDSENILLSVHKPEYKKCPNPDVKLEAWLLPEWDNFHKQALVREFLPNSDEDETNVVMWADEKERLEIYDAWIEKRNEWVEKQKIIEKTRSLFTDLYRLYFELQRESETEEIIVANGMLCDKENSQICHPILTHRVKLEYDADKNTVYILDTDASSELYTVLFQKMEGINLDGIKKMNETLGLEDYHPLDRNDTPDFLKVLVHQLSSNSLFSDSGVPRNWKDSCRVLLYWEPCYIVRKRLDGTAKAIESIIEDVGKNGEIPAPIRDIVSGGKIEVPENLSEISIEEQLAAVGGESVDILLSKEANKEQLEIARRIEYYNAVLVQGPPGTGKTHTIANLMGHFLAQGKSVLVTSHTTKALSVLKEKVAPGLQNLCVSVLEDSNLDMERSVDGITNYMSKTNANELQREMEYIAEERKDIIQQLAETRRKIFAIINQECNCIVYNGESISPSKAAEFVVDNAESLSYIPGKIRIKAPLPLSFEELNDLYRSNAGISADDEIELKNDIPDPSSLLTPMEFVEIWDAMQIATNKNEKIVKEKGWSTKLGDNDKKITIVGPFGEIEVRYPEETLIQKLKEYSQSFGKIEKWMKVAAVDGKKGGGYQQRWSTLIAQIKNANDYATSIVEEQFGLQIKVKELDNLLTQKNVFSAIRSVFAEKGKIGKLTMMMHKEYGIALESVSLNDKPIQSVKDCDLVLHYIELEEMRRQCAVYWDELLAVHSVPKFFDLDTENQEYIACKWIPYIQKYLSWYQEEYQVLLDMLSELSVSPEQIFGITPLDSELTATEKILFAVENIVPAICDLCLETKRIEEYKANINNTKVVLMNGKRGNSFICGEILSAIADGDKNAYIEGYAKLEKMFAKYELQRKRNELLSVLEPVAPQWAGAIRIRDGIHGSHTVPSDIEDAWKWKQLCGIVDEITEKPFAELQADSVRLSKEYRRTTACFAEKSGWYHLLKRTETDIDMKQALQGWKQTVKKIGKGTGKHAPMLKARARELMAKCQSAVPCWIMPINRALESLNPQTNQFDIVIIDEASQASISSLAILYLGKKLIIVGDDKQVSPMAVGLDMNKMLALQQMYIQDKIPNYHLYNAKTSIYDIAVTTFQPLMLREHFRCVPEIIGFSNMLSYDRKIKPLRDASNSVLLPAVVNYRVENGQRQGKSKTNENEAQAIVALIQSCIEQKEYDGKSFGVISLLGDEQVRLISQLIEKDIDPKEILKRRILCGNSANFQGDERDVIFLSVVDSAEGDGPLNKLSEGPEDAYRKRYNVATSRARDQLWVVHSLDAANDLKPGDLRKMLLDYTSNPGATEILHKDAEKNAESPFEAAVASKLLDRGFHLVQQWKVGAYRLDIVAVCGKKTVAIECDGEKWHSGQAKIREDMERQTILERLGWRFIRIRGSEFYREPEKTIERVVKELSKYGIEPEQIIEVTSEGRNTELLSRVKNRAAILLGKADNETKENYQKVMDELLVSEHPIYEKRVLTSEAEMELSDSLKPQNDFSEEQPEEMVCDAKEEQNYSLRAEKLTFDDSFENLNGNECEQKEMPTDCLESTCEESKEQTKDIPSGLMQQLDNLNDKKNETHGRSIENMTEEKVVSNNGCSIEKGEYPSTEVLRPKRKKESVADKLIKYKGLLDCGILTQEEFNEIKTRLLKEIL